MCQRFTRDFSYPQYYVEAMTRYCEDHRIRYTEHSTGGHLGWIDVIIWAESEDFIWNWTDQFVNQHAGTSHYASDPREYCIDTMHSSYEVNIEHAHVILRHHSQHAPEIARFIGGVNGTSEVCLNEQDSRTYVMFDVEPGKMPDVMKAIDDYIRIQGLNDTAQSPASSTSTWSSIADDW